MKFFLLGLLLASMGWMVQASDASPPHDMNKMWKASLVKPSLAVSVIFDEQGRLWRASARNGHVFVDHSDDSGKSWGQPVVVNPEPENIATDGENRPKIKRVKNGDIYISYTQSLDAPFSGNIRFSRSLDDGKSFSPPVTVNDNREIISHRFEAMGINSRGEVYLAWLDKRDLSAAQQKGQRYTGVSVYYARSDDGGASFHANVKAADHSCECCRVTMAMDADGVPVIAWRHIYGKNTRDHALLRLDGKSQPVRASNDGWEMDACPHHGPSLSIAEDGVYHFVWFTNAPQHHGLFYAYSTDQGNNFSTPLSFGDYDAQASHPYVLSLGKAVFIVWKEFDGKSSIIRFITSSDSGKSWSSPREIASTMGASDHPLLVGNAGRAYLSWNTDKESYRLIEVPVR